ncbi:hypothetical protein MG293_003393 [Ovis ammon polii]|uniref:Uncharacterized protein n=1 Tax=Ovis ammon polii TaxID=230172 RepID=A0AAD4YGF4_OVIAM|nr:hypothetical protein MG293_003393 [Ovis ammon polii]KAI4577025.1 hypothetical protein MJT46_002860 [Ovis ammon polii x Ovis aries]
MLGRLVWTGPAAGGCYLNCWVTRGPSQTRTPPSQLGFRPWIHVLLHISGPASASEVVGNQSFRGKAARLKQHQKDRQEGFALYRVHKPRVRHNSLLKSAALPCKLVQKAGHSRCKMSKVYISVQIDIRHQQSKLHLMAPQSVYQL